MSAKSRQPKTIPTDGQTPESRALEARARAFLQQGARREGPQISGVGELRALIDASMRRYEAERKLRAVQSEFNALVVGLKDKDGTPQLVNLVKRVLAIMDEIDAEHPGDPLRGIPSAREYMERVLVPQTEKALLNEMLADLDGGSEEESDTVNISKFNPPLAEVGS